MEYFEDGERRVILDIILMLLLMVCMAGISFRAEAESCSESEKNRFGYLSRDTTNAIKGIFLIVVFVRHIEGYVDYYESLGTVAKAFSDNLGQLLVAPFLFYSGYGVMEAIQAKGQDYVKGMPVKRLFLTLLHFDLAVILYGITGLLMGKTFSLKQIVLSFVCWDSLGNSNWYIFCMLFLYLFTYLAFQICKKNRVLAVALCVLQSIGYILVMQRVRGNETWWYNTVFCYDVGLLFSLGKNKIDRAVQKNNVCYLFSLAVCFSLFFLAHLNRKSDNIWIYLFWTACFSVLCVLLSMKIDLKNPLLIYIGKNLFTLYIMQRLPMIVLKEYFHCQEHPYMYFVLCAVLTAVLAAGFDLVLKKIDGILLKK